MRKACPISLIFVLMAEPLNLALRLSFEFGIWLVIKKTIRLVFFDIDKMINILIMFDSRLISCSDGNTGI